jgi:uncharacterized protein YkwD
MTRLSRRLLGINLLLLFTIIFLLLTGFILFQPKEVILSKQIKRQMIYPTPILRSSQGLKAKIIYKKVLPTQMPWVVQARLQHSVGKTSSDQVDMIRQTDAYKWQADHAAGGTMASASEIFEALNIFRQRHKVPTLSWDDKLANFAKKRAETFMISGQIDQHAGFKDFLDNNDGFVKLGFSALGENSSFGYQLKAKHLIERVYAGDIMHNNNQLNPVWTHVGIGVSGTATDLVFGGGNVRH